jgi:hypothetical protein
MEVCPLSREVMLRSVAALNLYPLDYGAAFALSIVPYPQSCRLALRLAFPHFDFIQSRMKQSEGEQRAYHVPRECQSGLGLAYPPVAHRLRQVKLKHLNLATHHFGSSLFLSGNRSQHLRLVKSHDVYQRFTCVAHITRS